MDNPAKRTRVKRLALSLAALLVAIAAGVIVFSQPPEGRVYGACRDSQTGEPLANVVITLDRKDSDDTDSSDNASDDNSDDSSDSDSAPASWSQGSDSDSDLDITGADKSPRSEWRAVTDSQGRYEFPHVRTGEYKVNAASTSHSMPEETVVVMEGQSAKKDLPMDRIGPNITFETSNFNWLPTENPTVALEGLLDSRQVTISVQRVDLDKTPAPAVSDMASGDARLDPSQYQAKPVFVPVRRWTHAVANADKEGSFYDRISLATDGLPRGSGLKTLPPGLYRITAKTRDENTFVEATSWAVVTTLAIVSKTYNNQALVYVADLGNGRPVSGVNVAMYNQSTGDKQTLLSSGVSGPDGTVKLQTAAASKESAGILFARSGQSVCSLDIDLNSPGSDDADSDDDTATVLPSNAPALRSFIFTERPVYRPGQTAYVKGIMRLFDRDKGFIVPANQKVALDIRDAQDTLISHQTVTTNDMGSWTAHVDLSPETLTGEYTVRAEMDGRVGNATFEVAAYKKPEYQANVTFSKDRYVRGDTIQATVTASYYYGAPVAGAKAEVVVTRDTEGTDNASDQPMHVNSDDSDSDSGEVVLDTNVVLDGNGQARISVPTKDQPQTEWDTSYNVDATIEEADQTIDAQGDATVAQGDFSLDVSPASTIAHQGDTVAVAVCASGDNDKPFPGQGVTLTAEYRDWDWQSDQEHVTKVSTSQAATGPDGTAQFHVTVPRVGLLTLSASATDTHGNQITGEDDVWVPGDREEIQTRFSDLDLVLDKKKYQPGDTAHLLINTAHPGATALVSIEGSTLYRYQMVPLTRNSTSVDIPVEVAFAPSVTVSVCCVTHKQFYQSTQDLTIDDPGRPLTVAVTPDKPSYHPDDPAVITIKTTDRNGRPEPAEISVGVVDSAVYAIQPEPPGTILDAMQPDQNDIVQTANSCETVYYGDVDKGATDVDIRKRFPDTALWNPDLHTGPDGTAKVALKLPDTLTTWRITCYGHTMATMVGKGVGNMVVNKDLLVRLETPPFLTAGSKSTLIAMVHNNTSQPVHADVRLMVQRLRVLSGDTDPAITVLPGKPVELSWQVQADQPGQAQATVTAVAGSLSDGIQEQFAVNPHGAMISSWHAGSLLHNVSQTMTLDPNAIPGSSVLRIRLAPSIASSLYPALDYLSTYPYGCTDATVSALVPDAVLAGAGGTEKPTGNPAINLTDGQKARLRDEVDRSLLRLYRMQRDDGGWGWFITDQSDLWMTADATWGLELAKASGFPVKQNVLDAASDETAKLASDERDSKYPDYESIALASLALAVAGDRDSALGNAHWLEKMWRKYPDTQESHDLAMVALAEWTVGHGNVKDPETEQAFALMTGLWNVARVTGSECSWAEGFHRSSEAAGEDTPDALSTAWCLYAADSITPSDPRIEHVARWLIQNRTDDYWACPWDTSIAILGLSSYLRSAHEMQPDFDANVTVNGHIVSTVHFGAESIDQPDRVIELPGTSLSAGANTVSFTKKGSGRLYYSMELAQCMPQAMPPPAPNLWQKLIGHIDGTYPPKLAPAPSGYRIRRVYLRLTSRRSFFWEDTVPAPDTHFRHDDDILVRLIIDCTRPGSRVVIEEPIPAGCRVTDANSEDMSDWSDWWDYTDVRDDKIVFFVHNFQPGEQEIDYHLQAQTAGSYDVMPPEITSMVDPTLQALGKPSHIDIAGGGS